MLTPKQLRLVQVARKQLALEDADYRAILRREAGVDSARDLDEDGFDAVLRHFKQLGFEHRPRRPQFGWRHGMASPAAVGRIRSSWARYAGPDRDNDAALGKWLERSFGVSHVRFLSARDAGKAITALNAMCGRKARTAA